MLLYFVNAARSVEKIAVGLVGTEYHRAKRIDIRRVGGDGRVVHRFLELCRLRFHLLDTAEHRRTDDTKYVSRADSAEDICHGVAYRYQVHPVFVCPMPMPTGCG